MTLRVAFNATPLLAPPTGIGQYMIQLGASLAATGEVDAYSFYGSAWRHEAPLSRVAAASTPGQLVLREVIKPFVPFKRGLRWLRQTTPFGRGLRRHRIALYHEANYVPIRYDVPVVITVHDLSWLRYRETHPIDRVRWLERAMPRALADAAAIVVDSEFVRQEVLDTFSLDAARVHKVHLGVSRRFRPRDDAETRGVLQRLGLSHGRYVLAVGTIEPRKNLGHAIDAHARLPEALQRSFPLVVAGGKGWHSESLERRLEDLVRKGVVRVLGYVPDAELALLYAGAAAFVFPSLYEGFGLPPLEAMASGVPVLVADRASLPEVTGEAAVKIDPDRPDDTSRALEAILEDAALRAEVVRRGLERAARFTWTQTAQATLAVYRQVA